MLDTSADTILEVFAAALETTAFVTLEPAPADTPCPPEALRLAMRFNSGDDARLIMIAPRAFGAYLAANTLAVAPDDPLALANAEDALREILNVSAGLYLARVTGPDGQVPEMGLPTVAPVTDESWVAAAGDPHAVVVLADGFPLLMQLDTSNS